MDILAHMLWANYGARTANPKLIEKKKKPINLTWVTIWAVFPDLFAFTITFLTLIPALFSGSFADGRPSTMGLAANLYQYSHSLVIWAVVFIIVWIIAKRPRLELLGWALHILIDIPSHAGNFYATPFLFPLSDWKFMHGVPWSNPTYMIINYSLLLIVTVYFLRKKKKINL